MQLIKQSTTSQPLVFLLIDDTDHITGATGITPTVTISKNGGAFAAPAGAVTEVGNGWYKVAGNATDTGTLGPLILHAEGTGADPYDICMSIVAFDPQNAVHLGLSSLPNAAANANGGLPILSSSGTTLDYTVSIVTTYTGNTPQTGDSFARIGANGVSLTSVGLAATQTFNNTGTWTGNIVGTLSTLTTYTGNTPQTGDSFARIGATGSGLTTLASASNLATANTSLVKVQAAVYDPLAISGSTMTLSNGAVLAVSSSARTIS